MGYEVNHDTGDVDRLNYDPVHDSSSLDVDKWSEQWLAWLADIDKADPGYVTAEQYIATQLGLHPAVRETDANNLRRYMELLCLIGAQNPYDATSTSEVEQRQHETWSRFQNDGRMLGQLLVSNTLCDSETYVAARIEREYAGIDYLTGAFNRLGLEREMERKYQITNQSASQTEADGAPEVRTLAHVYLDANRFRWINKTLGHHIGDAAIVETYWAITDMFRSDDTIYRYGGDEFGVVIAGLNQVEVDAVVQRIVDQQLEKARGPTYCDAMDAIERGLRAVYESGQLLRIAARPRRLSTAQTADGERPYHMLYINGVEVTELRNIITLALGTRAGTVTSLSDLESQRQEADKAMLDTKKQFDDLLRRMHPVEDDASDKPS